MYSNFSKLTNVSQNLNKVMLIYSSYKTQTLTSHIDYKNKLHVGSQNKFKIWLTIYLLKHSFVFTP